MDCEQKENSEDIQTDAQIEQEENHVVPSSQVSPRNESALSVPPGYKQLSDVFLSIQSTPSEKGFISSQRSLVFAQTARPITSAAHDEYLAYIPQMPDDLREENIDILIINADCDRNAAASFQNHLTKDILFYIHGQRRSPRVRLLDEVIHASMDNLDLAFSKALYVFLYVTKDFCSEPWTLLRGQACLTEAIHDFDKKWCVVPIHTTSKKSQRYKLPMMLNSLRAINYWSGNQDQFYIEGVRKLLESKTGLLLERERFLDEARRKYFGENCTELIKNAQYKDKGLSGCTKHVSHQVSESNCPPLTYLASTAEGSSKPSDVHTSSSGVYQSSAYRYSSFTDPHDDKAFPNESIAIIGQKIEENVAVDQDNDLHVSIRNSPTDRSSKRPDRGAIHQLFGMNSEMPSQRISQPVSGRSRERQTQDIPQQVSGRSHNRQSQGIPEQASCRTHKRQSQVTPQQASGESHKGQSQGTPQRTSGRSHEGQSQSTPQQASGRSHKEQSQGTPQQASGRSREGQSQGTPQQASGRSHEGQSEGVLQQSQFSAVDTIKGGIENVNITNRTFDAKELDDSVDVDGPGDEPLSVPAQENHVPHFYQHRFIVPNTTTASFQSISPASASAPHNVQSGRVTSDHPAASPMPGHVNYHVPNYFPAMGHQSYQPRYFHPVPPSTFYPYYDPNQHLYPSFPSQHYPPMQPYTLQELYNYANPIPLPSGFFQNEMRSQSQISVLTPSNDSTHTSVEGNAPNSMQSELSHSLSTSALSAVASLSGLSSHWPPSENLSCTVPFHPQPGSNLTKHFPTSAPWTNQPVQQMPANSAQQSQPRIPISAEQESFIANHVGTGQTASAADTHSSAKSDRTFSVGPSSAANSVIQHIHHHHHQKTITVAKATNVLIGDKSTISNKNSVDVISDDDSRGNSDDDEDNTEDNTSTSGPSNITRSRKPSSGSNGSSQRTNDDVQSENPEYRNVSMGFPEFLNPPSRRQPVERSEIEYAVSDDGKDQTCHKKL